MLSAVYPGSFDPITFGHLDIIVRASKCFDKLYVVVFENKGKTPLFSVSERVAMIQEECSGLPNVEVLSSSGLLVDFAKKHGVKVIVKGLRAVSDFDYEFKMALMNKKLAPDIETVFMMTSLKYLYLSSSLVKEVASYGGCIKDLVPPGVEKRVFERMNVQRMSQ
ncbi:MAG: pantetheine-phosphate adenylyltransferase [Candidatus Fermentithermobacillus carboniphilus]|uniref:Phosphopantetheine adenylyltransferase n=1 Tax=Candidatus Fermentithermobacillus carboniphilus TaxID=3085328 RepID=A0AAT9LEV0_9FIRM|nr:MAG: pantetheine-phosphate adenylyltransferase [Candidatus Fermentithermobacillus carboniphilus]